MKNPSLYSGFWMNFTIVMLTALLILYEFGCKLIYHIEYNGSDIVGQINWIEIFKLTDW